MEQEASELTPQDLAEAREAVERLLQAAQQGDEATARELLILGEGEEMNFKSMHASTVSYELGEPQADGELAVVESKILGPAPDDGGEPKEQCLPFVLRRVDGAWKVDMGASMTRMLGVDLGEAMTQLAEGLGNAMAKGMGAVAEGFSALAEPEAAPEGEDPTFRDALDMVRSTVLPEEAAAVAEALGKELDIVVVWGSMRGSTDAVSGVGPLVLGQLSEAIRTVSEDAEEREKLQAALDRVVIWHVKAPAERLCVLDGGQLELAVCLLDQSDDEDVQGFYMSDEIADVLRQAIQ
ncbi:MAG TPA: hypothetical protein VNE39_25880 [Planctomycetota bacterium]|nr:hypothetical protein [Planctomycetota bacterium]